MNAHSFYPSIWIKSLLFFLICAVPAVPAAAAVDPGSFRFEAAVDSLTPGQLYGLHLTADVLTRCRGDLADLRLYNAQGQEVAFMVVEDRTPGQSAVSVTLKMVHYQQNTNSVTLEVEIPQQAGPLSSIRLDTPERDFRRFCRIEADIGAGFTPLTQGEVFDFSSQVDLRQVTLKLPTQNFNRLRITLEQIGETTDAGEKNLHLRYGDLDFNVSGREVKPLRIDGVTGIPARQRLPREERDSLTLKLEGPFTEGTRTHRWQARTGLAFDQVRFTVTTPAFHRRIQLHGVKDPDKMERYQLSSSTLYRLPFGTPPAARLELTASPSAWPWLVIVSEDGDDPALDIRNVEITWVRKRLLFHAPEGPVTLRAGADGVTAPQYDMAKMINASKWQELPWQAVSVRPMAAATSYTPPVPPSDGKAEKQLLTIVILILVMVLGIVFYRVLKEDPEEGNAENGERKEGE